MRQQAQAIYRKARLPGKSAFSAYFLEDLFAAEQPAGKAEAVAPRDLPGDRTPERKLSVI